MRKRMILLGLLAGMCLAWLSACHIHHHGRHHVIDHHGHGLVPPGHAKRR